jgi:cytidyltransferase-like protein
MKTIYTKVVADLFHPGHVNFLKNARALGDRLVVHVVEDQRVAVAKRLPIMTHAERIAVVESCRYVDLVVAEGPKVITIDFLRRQDYAIYAFSFAHLRELQTKLRDCGDLPDSMIARLAYTANISTTLLLNRIEERRRQVDQQAA